jgi:hypothetical protein
MASHLSDKLAAQLMRALVGGLKAAPPASSAARTYLQAIGSCSKSLSFRFAPFVSECVPLVEQQSKVPDAESSDVKESALLALACIVKACPEVCFRPFRPQQQGRISFKSFYSCAHYLLVANSSLTCRLCNSVGVGSEAH